MGLFDRSSCCKLSNMLGAIEDVRGLASALGKLPYYSARLIALRAALRVLPAIATDESEKRTRSAVFRALFVSWAACKFPNHDMFSAASAAADSAAAVAHSSTEPAGWRAASAAASAAAAALDDSHVRYAAAAEFTIDDSAGYAAAAVAAAIRAAHEAANHPMHVTTSYVADAARASTWKQTIEDIALIEQASEATLLRIPLWRGAVPPALSALQAKLFSGLDGDQYHAGIWNDWYRRRLQGVEYGFLPVAEDDEILALRLIEQDDKFWSQDFAEISAKIAGWIEELSRHGDAPEAANRGAMDVRQLAASVAVPDVVVQDGRLAIGASKGSGKPVGQIPPRPLDLLRRHSQRICANYPQNAPAEYLRYAADYLDHLNTLDGVPDIGWLNDCIVPFALGCRAMNFDEWPDPAYPVDIEAFVVRHQKFSSNYSQATRENLFADARLDPVLGTQNAILKQVQAVADAIDKVAEAGATTSEFDATIQRQLEIARNLDDGTGVNSDKRGANEKIKSRFVLNQVGFYERVLMATAAVATIYAVPAVQAAIPIIERAIQQLLALLL